MLIEQRRQGTAVLATQLVEQVVLGDRVFDEDRIDEHQAVLQELQRQRRHFLLLAAVHREDPLPTTHSIAFSGNVLGLSQSA
jgi:hypothetical protein